MHFFCFIFISKTYFNTSHVVIQQARIEESLTQFCQFQYITCYYSTHHEECVLHFHTYFNTSHVIIQPTKNRHSCILLISINHDLKPFFQHFTNHSIENQIFVRNHVFTPFDRLFQKITW